MYPSLRNSPEGHLAPCCHHGPLLRTSHCSGVVGRAWAHGTLSGRQGGWESSRTVLHRTQWMILPSLPRLGYSHPTPHFVTFTSLLYYHLLNICVKLPSIHSLLQKPSFMSLLERALCINRRHQWPENHIYHRLTRHRSVP